MRFWGLVVSVRGTGTCKETLDTTQSIWVMGFPIFRFWGPFLNKTQFFRGSTSCLKQVRILKKVVSPGFGVPNGPNWILPEAEGQFFQGSGTQRPQGCKSLGTRSPRMQGSQGLAPLLGSWALGGPYLPSCRLPRNSCGQGCWALRTMDRFGPCASSLVSAGPLAP